MKSLAYVTSFQSVQAIWGEDKHALTHFLFLFFYVYKMHFQNKLMFKGVILLSFACIIPDK